MVFRFTVAFLISCLTTISTLAQQVGSYSAPRTEHGHPDFQGVWMLNFLTPLERPDGIQNLVITPEQARALATENQFQLPEIADPDDYIIGANSLGVVKGEYRSSVIVQPNGAVMKVTIPYPVYCVAANSKPPD